MGRAIDARDAKTIQALARAQVDAGARMLDVNTGPGRDDAPEAMRWLVETVQDVVEARLSIDTPGLKTLQAGLAAVRRTPLINSTTAEAKRMACFFPLAKEHSAEIVCLTLDERGVPNSVEARAELAMRLLTSALEHDLGPDRLYLDPVVLPLSCAQDQCRVACDAITALRALNSPPPRTLVGLSNVSTGAQERELLNRTYLAMLLGRGLDAAILDPTDAELMRCVRAAEVLLGHVLFAPSVLKR